MKAWERKAWKSRRWLCSELGIQPSDLDSIIKDLRLASADQRTVGSVQVLSPEICDVIAAVIAHDRRSASP